MFPGQHYGGVPVICFRNHPDIRLVRKQLAQSFSHDRVVVGKKDFYDHYLFLPGTSPAENSSFPFSLPVPGLHDKAWTSSEDLAIGESPILEE